VHAYCILADSSESARPTPQSVQRLPKLFYRLRRLVWKINVTRLDWGELTEAPNDLFSSCSGHTVMLQEMRVEIDNGSKMLLTYKNAKVLQKAENIVAVVERYLQTSFAVLRAAVCCVCDLLRCQRTAVPH
jgi:hypothetical protein